MSMPQSAAIAALRAPESHADPHPVLAQTIAALKPFQMYVDVCSETDGAESWMEREKLCVPESGPLSRSRSLQRSTPGRISRAMHCGRWSRRRGRDNSRRSRAQVGDSELGIREARETFALSPEIARAAPELYDVRSDDLACTCQKRSACCLYFKSPGRNFCASCPTCRKKNGSNATWPGSARSARPANSGRSRVPADPIRPTHCRCSAARRFPRARCGSSQDCPSLRRDP